MSQDLRSELAPTGTLRAGLNMANFLLISGRTADGDPEGVAPDMAREIATRLGVPVSYVPYETPGQLADEAAHDVWDIGLIGAEPARAEHMAFTAAYVEIEATYLVPAAVKAMASLLACASMWLVWTVPGDTTVERRLGYAFLEASASVSQAPARD